MPNSVSWDERKRLPRWYERERWSYEVDRQLVEEAARWLEQVEWKLIGTFTFAGWKVSDEKADKTFINFINELERTVKSDVAYVRGDEKSPASGSKPACGRHFHFVLTSVAPLHPAFVAWLWTEQAGDNSDDPTAKVEAYKPGAKGIEYLLKSIQKPDGGWAVRKLELFHPEARSLHDMTKRFRRHLRRHKARQLQFTCAEL
jgi:hypothetical protein